LPDLKKAEEKSPKPLPHKRDGFSGSGGADGSQHHSRQLGFLAVAVVLVYHHYC